MACISILSINTQGTTKNYNNIIDEIKSFDIVLVYNKPELLEKMQKDTNSIAQYSTDNKNKLSIATHSNLKKTKRLYRTQ